MFKIDVRTDESWHEKLKKKQKIMSFTQTTSIHIYFILFFDFTSLFFYLLTDILEF